MEYWLRNNPFQKVEYEPIFPLFHHSRFPLGVLVLSTKSFSANYVLRIYRYDKNNPHHLVGLVEEVGVKGKKALPLR